MKRFPSIKKNTEYRAVSRQGKSKACGPLVMYICENGKETNRLGITISHREGNSVVRHTFARRMREIFRKYNHQTVQGKDIVVVARNRAGSASFDELCDCYEKLLSFHNIYIELK